MADGTLYLGTRRYSSWSLRGWLAVRAAGLDVEEVVIPLAGGGTPAVKAVSPNGLVPYLEHRRSGQEARIWESLAIGEYCAEIAPRLWPAAPAARAHGRAISAEMHAEFRALRIALPMNLGRRRASGGQTAEVLEDIARIEAIWTTTLSTYGGGPFLFGADFTIADAMFAPVVARFLSYQPPLSRAARDYCAAVRAYPLVVRWYELAAEEPASWRLDKYEGIA